MSIQRKLWKIALNGKIQKKNIWLYNSIDCTSTISSCFEENFDQVSIVIFFARARMNKLIAIMTKIKQLILDLQLNRRFFLEIVVGKKWCGIIELTSRSAQVNLVEMKLRQRNIRGDELYCCSMLF